MFSLVILFITSSIIAQSHAEYYPLQIGNKWFYETTNYDSGSTPTVTYYSKEVIGDTVMDNGIKYYVVHDNGSTQYERYDTLTNEIKYYSMGSKPVIDVSLYSLNYKKDSTVVWKSTYNPWITFQISFKQQASSDTSFINIYAEGLTSQFVSFKKYIGINNFGDSYDFGDNNSNLIGYRINGKEWGHLTSVNVNNIINPEYRLEQNYPNPFNPVTTIVYEIPVYSHVKIIVYNSLGEAVRILQNKYLSPGNYKLNFNAGNLASGVYFYQLLTDDKVLTKKLLLIK